MEDTNTIAAYLSHFFGSQGFFNLAIAGRLFLAIAIGLLIGMEREIASLRSQRPKIAGVRTIVFITLLGGLTILVDPSGLLTIIMLSIISIFLTAAYIRTFHPGDSAGLTTPIVVLVAYLLGIMALRGNVAVELGGQLLVLDLTQFSVIVCIAVIALLSMKPAIHKVASAITPEEFFSSLKFAVIAFIILPFLPNISLGDMVETGNPISQAALEAINFYKLWFMVVLISGIGFVGYVLGKILGPGRGVGVSGFLGGLVSSTAVMSATAERSKGSNRLLSALIFATTIASVTSFVRVALEVLAINRQLLPDIMLPLSLMSVIALGSVIFLHKNTAAHKDAGDVDHKSPFSLGPALKFTAFILGVKVAMNLALALKIPGGLYITGIISGIADVDAVALSASSLAAAGKVSGFEASTSIILAVLMNMISKGGIAILFGSKAFGKRVGIAFGATVVAGIIGIGLNLFFA